MTQEENRLEQYKAKTEQETVRELMCREAIDRCPYCGAKVKRYWQHLTQGMVESLIIFAHKVKNTGVNEVHLTKGLSFTVNQWCNFRKLRYFGLAHRVKNPDGSFKAGCWLLTRNGGAFLRGDMLVPSRIKTFRNKIVEKGEELVGVYEFGRKLGYNDEYWQKEFDFDIFQGKLL